MSTQLIKRNMNLDVLKGICAYLVIVIHCGFPFWSAYIDAFCRVAVPLLFMISGYFCRGEWSEIKRKVVNLMKIFVAGEGLYFLYNFHIQGNGWRAWLLEQVDMDTIRKILIYNDTGIFMAGWFLLSLMYSYLIFGLFVKIRMKKQSYALIPLLILWLWGWQRVAMICRIDLKYLDVKVLRAVPFFLLGNFLRDKEDEIRHKCNGKWVYVLMIIGTFLVFFERLLIEQLVFKPALFLYLGNVILAVASFAWALYMSECKWLNGIAYIGKNLSLYIYVIHMWIFAMIGKTENVTYIFQVCILSTIVAWVLYRIRILFKNK